MSWSTTGPWTVPSTAVHVLEADGRRWRITVALPEGSRAEGQLTPVVYVLDPFGTLGVAVQVARITHLLSAGALPPLMVVGVGPDSDDLSELMQQRLNDLSPSPPTSVEGPAAELAYGGGGAFLDLLLDQIAPYVEREHGGDPADRTVAGWSLGGLLGAHALVTRPTAFRRYLLVSPSLWWSDAEVLAKVDALAGQAGELDVYLGAGDLEETAADRIWPALPAGAQSDARMVGNVLDFADALRGLRLEGLAVHAEVLGGEHHITVWPAAFSRGLLALHVPSYRLVQ